MYAKLTNSQRKAIYRRDGFQCAVCGSTRFLQIHHYIHRGQGGNDTPHNLITLCSDCHALAHGINLVGHVVAARGADARPRPPPQSGAALSGCRS